MHVADPDGRRLRIVPSSATDTIGDVARALTGAPMPMLVDGRWSPPGLRLTACPDLVEGATIVPWPGAEPPLVDTGTSVGAAADSDPVAPSPGALARVVAGPACDRPVLLAPGRHGIGRAAAMSVRIDDPDVEVHQAFLDVGDDGRLTLTQLTGRTAIVVDQQPIAGTADLRPGAVVRIGSSCVVVDAMRLPADAGPPTDAGRPSAARQRGGSVQAVGRHPWRRELHRTALEHDAVDPGPIPVPRAINSHPRPPATALIGAGCGVVGAVLVASLLGQLLFALVALVAACGSLVTWLVGVVGAARRRRRERRRYAADVSAFRAHLARAAGEARRRRRRAIPDLGRVLAHSSLDHRQTWARRIDGGTIFGLLGPGDVTVALPIDADAAADLDLGLQRDLDRASRLEGVAVPVTIGDGESIAVVGPSGACDALCRSLVIQFATWYGPADLSILVVTGRPERWAWARWLPHVDLPHGCGVVPSDEQSLERALATTGAPDARFTLVVVDDPLALRSRTGPLRRHLDRTGAASLTVCGAETGAPARCTRVLAVGPTGRAQWHGVVPEDDRCTVLRPAGCSEAVAEGAARRLAHLVDPEAEEAAGRAIPQRVALGGLDPALSSDDPASVVLGRWRSGGPDPAPRAAIGRSADGIVEIDLARDGPHGLVAGTTGAGKSELLRTLVVGLAAAVSPEHLGFVLVDYKGGATFDRCVDLPHTVGVVTDLDDGLAERALASLESELHRREHALRRVGAGDLAAYRAAGPDERIARLVIVVDEFAVLAREVPDFLGALVDVARRGRSLGVHLLLATQRPAGVVDDDVRANTDLRVALRLADAGDARDVIGDDGPARFPRHVPGRAAIRLGSDEPVVFQTAVSDGSTDRRDPLRVEVIDPRSGVPVETASPCSRSGLVRRDRSAATAADTGTGAGPSELDRLVSVVREAARRGGVPAPRPPWTAPLPRHLEATDLVGALDEVEHDRREPNDAIGLVDDPRRQLRHLLRWVPDDGNLVLVGASRTGRTATLLSLATARCRVLPPDRCHLYVLDATADDRYDALRGVAHCAAVVRLHERERLHRVVHRLAGEIDRRAATSGPHPEILLVVDGIGTLRSAWSSIEDHDVLTLLDRVLADGPAAGIVTVCSADAGSPAAATVPAGERWFFHLGDQALGIGAGVPAVPRGVPGRVRIASSGLEAQVAAGAEGLAALPDDACGDRPPPVVRLPASVLLDELGDRRPPPDGATGTVALPVGRSFADLSVASIEIPAGDHVLVAGTARTGVSTTLASLARAWLVAHPHGRVIGPERTVRWMPGSPVDADLPVLVCVDDAHRVDDRGELLAAVRGECGAVTVVAGGRYDALRAAYGHWTKELARSRCGVILTSTGEVDGDLLGVALPRRTPIPARPGLGWVVDGGGTRLVQLARPGASGASPVTGPQRIRSER